MAALGERVYQRGVEEVRRTLLHVTPPRPGAVFVDVGCANGEYSVQAARHIGASQTIGLELADQFIEPARERGVEVRKADLAARWPLDDESVDILHSNQVIGHVAQTDNHMAEIRRVRAPAR